MKFTVNRDFKTAYGQFEVGNSHDSKKLGIAEDRVEAWYDAGWIEIEGRDPAPEPKPGPGRIRPNDSKLTAGEG